MIVVPLAVRDKLLFLENPRNRHLPFRAAAPVDPSALVSYEKVLAFDRLGLPEPRRLKHMRDDAVKAAAHRAHDEGETKKSRRSSTRSSTRKRSRRPSLSCTR